MESTEFRLEDELLESTEHVPASTPRPRRIATGTMAPPVDLDALRVAAEHHRSLQAWDELAETLRRIIEVGQVQDALGEDETIELYAELGQLASEELGDVGEAIDAWREVIAIDPSDLRALVALDDLYMREGHWEDAAHLLEKRALVLDDAQRLETLIQAGTLWEEKLADPARAAELYERVYRADPGQHFALARLEAMYEQLGKWVELVEMLLERSESISDVAQQLPIFHRVAKIYEDELGEVESAFYVLQAAFQLDHEHAQTVSELERLATAANLWDELAEKYLELGLDPVERRVAAEPSPEKRTALCVEHAESLERQEDVAGAIRAYEQALGHEPTSHAARTALERLHRAAQAWASLVDVLSRTAELTTDEDDLVRLQLELGSLYDERLADTGRSIAAYRQVLELERTNLAALGALEALYEQTAEHEALVETYRSHLAATVDVDKRVELWVAMGHVYEGHLHDIDRAIEAYNGALSLDDGDAEALAGASRLYEETGEWERAIEVLTRQLELCDDAHKPDLYWRMARIQYGELGDVSGAEASLLRGLALDPGHMASLEALTTQYSDRGDWQKAAQMMTRAESYTEVAVDKVRLLYAAASIHEYKLRGSAEAKQLYAAVIALDPEHVDAGRPLAALYFAAGQWAELSPVIDMLCRKVAQLHGEPKELGELYYRAARCAEELGDLGKALGAYKASYDRDATHVPTLVGHADLLFKKQEWESAGKLYQTILVQHRDGQREADVVRIYCRLGAIRQALGERKKALHMFEKALELDPHHRETLSQAIELQTQLGDWEAVVRGKRALLATSEDHEKPKLLDEIAAVHRRLQNAPKATGAYLEALEIAPDDHQLLQKVLDIYIETKQWRAAVEIMERFIALERDAVRRGVYYHAAATVCRDELKAFDEAVGYYDCALDSFFSEPERLDEPQLARALKSFEAIDKLLTTQRDWKAQERAYREMIKRLPTGAPRFFKLQVSLLDGLGEIYRSRLKQYQDASEVFELAQQLDVDNELRRDGHDRAEILAELYVLADCADKAIAQHTRMLQREPFKYDSYKALARIYRDTRQYDKQWCVCSALKFLKKADADELDFYEQHKPRGLVKAKQMMSPASWTKLAHPDENRYISAIFGASWHGVAAMKAFPHKDLGVKREDRHQLQGDQLMFSKLFLYLAQVLSVPVPEVYLVDDNRAADIQLANAIERSELCPSFVVRPHMLQGKSEREVAFLLARRLVFMRPEYYLRMLLPTNTELKVALLSAIVMLQPQFPVPPNMVATIQQYLPRMRKCMPPHALEQLDMIMQRFMKTTVEIDLAKWAHAVDAVSHRAGFLMCGDLEVAARAVATEPVVVDGPSIKDKVKRLVLFSISEEYFAVRAQTGLAIG